MKSLCAILVVLISSLHGTAASGFDFDANNAKTIYARSYGFFAANTAPANTKALQKISAFINQNRGGVTLIINKGTYRIGGETFAGATGKGFAYRGESMLQLTGCTKPVVIDGRGAVLKLADGLHFGAFDPETGKAHNAPKGGFTNYNYAAYPGSILDFRNNSSITVRNLTLDGNVQNLVLGGYWGDVGFQLPADGVFSIDNDLTLRNVTGRFCGRDGVQVGNKVASSSSLDNRVFFYDCIFDGNTRQGLSWIGGNHLNAVRTQFINTGKTISNTTTLAVRSAPGAGVDMESEVGHIRNGVFTNCIIYNNDGAGLLTVGDVGNIAYNGGKIIGTTGWTIYGSGPGAKFSKTLIVGSLVNLRTGSGPADPLNAKFENCRITLDPKYSPNGKVYGNYVMDFGGGAGGWFSNCVIDSHERGTVYGGDGCVFIDCTFYQQQTANGYNGYPFMRGNFYGTNRWYKPGGVNLENLQKSKIAGNFYVNDVDVKTGRKLPK